MLHIDIPVGFHNILDPVKFKNDIDKTIEFALKIHDQEELNNISTSLKSNKDLVQHKLKGTGITADSKILKTELTKLVIDRLSAIFDRAQLTGLPKLIVTHHRTEHGDTFMVDQTYMNEVKKALKKLGLEDKEVNKLALDLERGIVQLNKAVVLEQHDTNWKEKLIIATMIVTAALLAIGVTVLIATYASVPLVGLLGFAVGFGLSETATTATAIAGKNFILGEHGLSRTTAGMMLYKAIGYKIPSMKSIINDPESEFCGFKHKKHETDTEHALLIQNHIKHSIKYCYELINAVDAIHHAVDKKVAEHKKTAEHVAGTKLR